MDEILRAIGPWTTRDGPRYARLASALADAVARDLVARGTRLPAERVLADALGISRGTVVAAYDTLRARRLAETRRGSGTVITGTPDRAIHRASVITRLIDHGAVPIDLAVASCQGLDGLPGRSVSLARAAELLPAHGYAPLGAPALREAIAHHLRGAQVPAAADEVIVTSGGQGALSLVASALVAPGDRVLVEAPTYAGAIEVFSRAGARVDGLERDAQGPRPETLDRALARADTRFVYLVPTCHNPTGTVMGERRRRELLRVAADRGVPVVEDTVMEALLLRGTPPRPMGAMDLGHVLTIGSLSKTIWGGLRVGWVRSPPETLQRLARAKGAMDFGISGVAQALALELMGELPELAERRRGQVRERLEIMVAALREHIPEWEVEMPRGGWSLWIRLPRGSGDDLAQLALRRGVAIAPGRSTASDDTFADHARISVGAAPDLLREGAHRLAAAWEDLAGLPMGATSEPAFVV